MWARDGGAGGWFGGSVTASHLPSVDWEVGVVLEGRAQAVPLPPFRPLFLLRFLISDTDVTDSTLGRFSDHRNHSRMDEMTESEFEMTLKR